MNNTEKIRELEVSAATLVVRVDILREDLKRYEELATEVSIIKHRASAIEKQLEGLLSHRWDILKLILAAILGSILTVGAGLVSRWVDRQIPSPSNSSMPGRAMEEPRK